MTKSQVKTTTNDVSRREILAGAIGAATATAAAALSAASPAVAGVLSRRRCGDPWSNRQQDHHA